MASIQYCILLIAALSPLILHQTHYNNMLVEANDWLIQVECHNAKVPATCIQCLQSYHHSEKANAAAIATAVVGCLNNHCTSLIDNMAHLATFKHDKVSVQAYEDCGRLLLNAKMELVEAAVKIDKGDYDGADHLVYSAFDYGVQCHNEIDEEGRRSKIDVPMKVQYKIRVLEELCEAAMRIIERL